MTREEVRWPKTYRGPTERDLVLFRLKT